MLRFSKPDAENFFRVVHVENFAVSPDEKQLVFSANINGRYNLWAMDLPNAFPYPFAFYGQNTDALRFDKEGRFLIASFDKDGDENLQIYALPPHGGEWVPLRVQEGERHFFIDLSEDGRRLYYTTTKNNPTFLNTYVYDIETGEETLILEGKDAGTTLCAVSPGENSVVYGKFFSNSHSRGYVRAGGNDFPLIPDAEEPHLEGEFVYVSENEIYFLTNYQSDFVYLAKFDVSAKRFSKVLQMDKEEFSLLRYGKKDQVLYIVGSYGMEDRLYRYDLKTGEAKQLNLPASVVEKLTVADSGNLYILARSATRPNNIYRSADGGMTWEELTRCRVPGISEADLVEPEIVKYPSFDGLEIEALFFRAKGEKANGHVILWPHGGPQAAERKMFRALFQLLLSRGYSIFAPNFRGSTNYGLKFLKMVERDWGGGPRLDNIAGLEWLIKNGYADREKIFLMGGSYGGYMALLLHGRHAEYFKAVVDIFGVSNLFSFIESMPEFWKPMAREWVGDPEKDKEKLTEDSPITYIDGMVKPMLVVQGANDPRVVKNESDQIVEALRKKGREVEYIVLEDEGHGFSKKENEINVYKKILAFFDKHAK